MADQIQDLIAKKNYPKAIELLKALTSSKPHDRRARLQLADVLILAGRGKEAAPVLMTLADQEAKDGFAAKAIAILKRIEKIDPGRRDVEAQLAGLIQSKPTTAATPRPSAPKSAVAFGFEEIDSSSDIQLGVGSPAPEPAPALDLGGLSADPAPSLELGDISASSTATTDDGAAVAEFDESFALSSEPAEAPRKAGLSTPLFEGFSEDELLAVMRGLKLVSFEAGDIIVGEGAPGNSMFILTSGRVKAYVKKPTGDFLKVQEFDEGDFFGEIAVLTGKPRTATLTAAEPSDCLELDRQTLDEITKSHPGVREVLKKFQADRAKATVMAILKG